MTWEYCQSRHLANDNESAVTDFRNITGQSCSKWAKACVTSLALKRCIRSMAIRLISLKIRKEKKLLFQPLKVINPHINLGKNIFIHADIDDIGKTFDQLYSKCVL